MWGRAFQVGPDPPFAIRSARMTNMESARSLPAVRQKAENLSVRADKEWEHRRLKTAFRLMRQAALLGELAAQVNVGYMYDTSTGVKRDLKKALYWYKRAYRRGASSAASNIGTIWRDRNACGRAMYWFNRAIALHGGDDGDASLEIAKIYLLHRQDKVAAERCLRFVLKSNYVTEDGREQARTLLKKLSRRTAKLTPRSR